MPRLIRNTISVKGIIQYLLILLFIGGSNCMNFSSPALCTSNVTVDCTNQLGSQYASTNSCVIHPTAKCQQMRMSIWPEMNQISSEKDSSFKISLDPYIYSTETILNVHRYYSAFNISIETENNDITGFFFFLQQKTHNLVTYNSCRVFDYSNAKLLGHPLSSVDLYYDCYVNLEKGGLFIYDLIVRAVPLNEELHYKIYVPTYSQIAPSSLCEWLPVIMVNRHALSRGRVECKFSTLKRNLVANYFSVKLLDVTNNHALLKNVSVDLLPDQKMYHVQFDLIPEGNYQISVAPVSSTQEFECVPSDVLDIIVSEYYDEPNYHWLYATILCFIILAVLVIGYVIFKHCNSTTMENAEFAIPKVLVLYSYDCHQHMEVVRKFAEYLKTSCKMTVILDEWDLMNQDPVIWIPSMIQEAEYIVIIVSQGVYHKVEKNNSPEMMEESPWGDQFTPAYRHLMNLSHTGDHSHRIIKVVFDTYVQTRRHVPKLLFPLGTTFKLMSEFNNFQWQRTQQEHQS